MLSVTFGSQRGRGGAAGSALCLHWRRAGPVCPGIHLNMSSVVGFTALFGVAIMDGVLMVRWISTLAGSAWSWRAIGADQKRLRRSTSMVTPSFGHFPPRWPSGLGSDYAVPAGHGDRLGAVQFHNPYALRSCLSSTASSFPGCPRPRPRRPLRRPSAKAGRASPGRDDHRYRQPLEHLQASGGSRTCSGFRRNQPRIRPRDWRGDGRRDARFIRHTWPHGRPGAQG